LRPFNAIERRAYRINHSRIASDLRDFGGELREKRIDVSVVLVRVHLNGT